jgi:NitT/TauT family transport system ATP-binding protein
VNLLDVAGVSYFIGDLEIIKDATFKANDGEFVSLIGPSGCGKSTLLRIIAGLIRPTKGKVMYLGKEIVEPIPEISFVFQDFALLPWLNNVENVEIGLSRSNISEEGKREKALEILRHVGLSGFEYAYPNALSGGMKQRVGIARAIVSEPKILLMDEPFSSLDELTAEALRKDVYTMLKSKDNPVSSVIMVTHNVEEAVELSDKIVVMAQKPSYVKKILEVKLGRPRNKYSKEFRDYVNTVYKLLTA